MTIDRERFAHAYVFMDGDTDSPMGAVLFQQQEIPSAGMLAQVATQYCVERGLNVRDIQPILSGISFVAWDREGDRSMTLVMAGHRAGYLR